MAVFASERFEQAMEAFLHARTRRDWQVGAGLRTRLGLHALYERDYPSLTSFELYGDLLEAPLEGDRKQRLRAGLAAAHLEGRTVDVAERSAHLGAAASIVLDDQEVPARSLPVRWATIATVAERHAMQSAWRTWVERELNPVLAQWRDDLQAAARRLPAGNASPLELLDPLDGATIRSATALAKALLGDERALQGYRHALGIYLGQFDLPIDDAWTADADWAFRASRFDDAFPSKALMPTVVRTLRDMGVELEEQPSIRLDFELRPLKRSGVRTYPLDVPREVHVVAGPLAGYAAYAGMLRALGEAEHAAHTDATLSVYTRRQGDGTPTSAYGLLLEGLVLDPLWLRERLGYERSEDFLIIAQLARQVRIRTLCAEILYVRELWADEPLGLGAAYADGLTSATGIWHAGEEHLLPLLGAPWSLLRAHQELRAHVFEAQLRQYLRREFDEEWWRNRRAGRFLQQELWRPGQRHSAEELLTFMGYAGFDSDAVWSELAAMLSAV